MQRVPIVAVACDLEPITDEALAVACSARLLITGAVGAATMLVRRIHDASTRADRPCVQVAVRDFPADADAFSDAWARLLDDAAGGTVLLSGIEQMEPAIQDAFVTLLDAWHDARVRVDVRLVTTTASSLRDLVVASRFSEQLFYRLNTIHLIVPAQAQAA